MLDDKVESLALNPREAARALGVSARTLWAWTKAELVPHVRIGRKILYPIDELKRWLGDRIARQVPHKSD
jgi:excisionase family DNA binding protein